MRPVVPPAPPTIVVLCPDLLGRSFGDPQCREVLHLWRDAKIRPALNRGLLIAYLRVLHALGLPETLTRRWAWWWNAADLTLFLDEQPAQPGSLMDLCSWVAQTARAACVVHSGHPFSPPLQIPAGLPPWRSAREFLQDPDLKPKPPWSSGAPAT